MTRPSRITRWIIPAAAIVAAMLRLVIRSDIELCGLLKVFGSSVSGKALAAGSFRFRTGNSH